MTVSTVTIHSPDGTSINVPITVTPPSGSPLWQADPTAPSFGFTILQGVCGHIAADPNLLTPARRPSLRIAVDDADTNVQPGPGNLPCRWGNRTDKPAASAITYALAGHTDLWFYQAFYIPLRQPGYTGAPTSTTPNTPGAAGCFPIVNASKGQSLMLSEWYGAPYGGSPPTVYTINSHGPDNYIKWAGGPIISGEQPWITPLLYDTWMQFVTHIVFSTDPTVGAVEIFTKTPAQSAYTPQPFRNGALTYRYPTITNVDSTGPEGWWVAMSYRPKSVLPGLLTLHHDSQARIGLTRQDVGG